MQLAPPNAPQTVRKAISLCIRYGHTYRTLAERLHVSHTHIMRVHKGINQPALDFALRVFRLADWKLSLDDSGHPDKLVR